MRAYARKCDGMRHVPVGLIMADSDRDENTLYYNCQMGDDDLDHAEWYGLNTYVYCNANHTSFDKAVGFKKLLQSFDSYNYSIPVLLTEFGCLSKSFATIDGYQGQRSFNQAKWLGLPDVQKDFAGGFVFEYSIESSNARTPFPFKELGPQNYGVGYFSPENCDDVTIMCEFNRTPSFYNLKKAYASAKALHLSINTFVPDESRTGRTKCPSHFPPLTTFQWAADRQMSARCPRQSDLAFTCPSPQTAGAMYEDWSATNLCSFLVLAAIVSVWYFFGKYFIVGLSPSRRRSTLPSDLWEDAQDTDADMTSEESRVFKPPRHAYSSLDSDSY